MIRLYMFISIILFLSCANSNSVQRYCAEIDRYNPKTYKESHYTLIVELQGNVLEKINYPNGGYSDNEDFGFPVFSDKIATFKDKKGVDYTIRLIKKGDDCFEKDNLKRCMGKNKDGTRCNNKTGSGGLHCRWHK